MSDLVGNPFCCFSQGNYKAFGQDLPSVIFFFIFIFFTFNLLDHQNVGSLIYIHRHYQL